MKTMWPTLVLVALVALLAGAFLGRRGVLRPAGAQSEGVIGRVMLLVGPPIDRFAPIVLVDTMEQSVVVYEYEYDGRLLRLQCARTYRYDKQLGQYGIAPPTVDQVRALVEQMGGAPR
jgi:hypothetical protein